MVSGLYSLPAISILIFWYITSFLTLIMNKETLTNLKVDSLLFATVQNIVSTIMGFINMFYPCYLGNKTITWSNRSKYFYFFMTIVGITRFLVVYLSLLSLEYVPVSFTETIKTSAPLFTVFLSFIIIKEQNGVFVILSLFPVMIGLVLCSKSEINFNFIGFFAALGTNVVECLQFVLCKKALNVKDYTTTPAEFQFYTCLLSLIFQIPLCLLFNYEYLINLINIHESVVFFMILNGIMYHYQSLSAWVLMQYINPVTHSVCNTVKRALSIWLSICYYGNQVTWQGLLGTIIMVIGVLLYNKARENNIIMKDKLKKDINNIMIKNDLII